MPNIEIIVLACVAFALACACGYLIKRLQRLQEALRGFMALADHQNKINEALFEESAQMRNHLIGLAMLIEGDGGHA